MVELNKLKKVLINCVCILVASSCFVYSINSVNSLKSINKNIMAQAEESTEASVIFKNTAPKVGEALEVTLKNISATDVTYSWTVGGKNISNTSSSYTPTEKDYENMITVTVTANSKKYTASMYFSELPVVYIDTADGNAVTSKEEYVDATCNMQGNSEYTNSSQLYSGDIQIRGRGNYTWEHEKKPYKIKLDSKTDVLGMGANKHWVLIAEYMDPTHLRNEIIPGISQTLQMEYTAESRPVVLVFNGEYNGLYHISENVRLGSERIDIFDWEEPAEDIAKAVYKAKKADGMTKDERDELDDYLTQHLTWVTSGEFTWNGTTYQVSDYVSIPDTIDGGYLLELDTYDYYHTTQVSDFETDGEQPVQFKNPEYAVTNDEMYNYAKDYIQSFEDAVSSDDFTAEYDGNQVHYSELFDIDSLVQYWMMMELITNSDAMRYSNYMYKDFGELFKIGPAWDYDWTWNAGYTVPTNEWWTDQSYYNETVHWYKYLVTDPYFLTKAYELYTSVDSELAQIYADGGEIDTYSENLETAAKADLAKWHSSTDYETEVSDLKTYIKSRFTWLDEQFSSVENLSDSLGYEASDKLEISSVSSENGKVKVTATVSDSTAASVVFQINGKNTETATVENGKATATFPVSYLESDSSSLNTVEIRMKDSNGTYIAASSGSSLGNNQWGGGWNQWQQQETTSTQIASLVYSNFTTFTADELGVSTKVQGDVDADGDFDLADVVMLEKWLIKSGNIEDPDAGDFTSDSKLNVSDLSIMKSKVLS
jgi:hypothetical protein